jgi:hypothetical protein
MIVDRYLFHNEVYVHDLLSVAFPLGRTDRGAAPRTVPAPPDDRTVLILRSEDLQQVEAERLDPVQHTEEGRLIR